MSIPVLDDWQERMRDETLACMARDVPGTALVLPTGGGKSIVGASVIHELMRQNWDIWWFAHREELLNQASAHMHSFGLTHGMVRPKHDLTTHNLHVASIQTVNARFSSLESRLRKGSLAVFDEAHHTTAATYARIAACFPRLLGPTATPWRKNGRPLSDFYKESIIGPSMAWLIENGYLCDFKIFAPPTKYDLGHIKKTAGDYNQGELEHIMLDPDITRDAIRAYAKFAAGLQCVVFCVSVKHAYMVATAFSQAGWLAEAIEGESKDRKGIIERFASGETQILVSCALIGEGFDCPIASCAILLDPTLSAMKYLQEVGRVSRLAIDKDFAILIDLARNVALHGMPQGQRKWSLERGLIEPAPRTRRCATCWCVCEVGSKVCPHCQTQYPVRKLVLPPPNKVNRLSHFATVGGYSAADIMQMQLSELLPLCTHLQAIETIADVRGFTREWVIKIYDHVQRIRGRI